MTEITRRGFVKGAALAPFAFQPVTLPQSSTKPENRFDFVVAGAGHNSLATAAYLCKAGFTCVVLEGRPTVGGGVKTAELTLAGFHHDVCSCEHGSIRENPMVRNNELKLGDYGLEYIFADPVKHVPFPDGSYITQWQDFDRTCDEIAKYSKKDAETYRRMATEAESVRSTLGANPFVPIGMEKQATSQAISARPDAKWQRRMAMTKWDVLQANFEDERTIAFMMTPWPVGVTSARTGMGGYPSRKVSWACPKGGSGMLSVALARYIEAHGGVILTNKPVTQLIVEGGKCMGVECADGSSYRGDKAVISTIHIKRLIDLAPRELWGDDFIEAVEAFQTGPAGFNTHYATTEPLRYPVKGGTLAPVNSTSLTSPQRGLRFEYELAVGEVDFEEPVMHIIQPSVIDPTRAPAGMHTIRVLGRQPYDLRDGGHERWEEIKEKVADAHLKFLQRLAPNLTNDKILARFITSPVNIEQMNAGMWHGSCHAGTEGPAQTGAMRPAPGWAQYRMPIPNLYQTGGTTHPGGGVSGGPGRNAAWVILKDFGMGIEEVVARKDETKS